MNSLGTDVLKVMEGSSLGRMSVYVLSKQSMDLGIDMDNMEPDDVPKIAARLKTVLPFFLGDETDKVLAQIRKLTNEKTVMST